MVQCPMWLLYRQESAPSLLRPEDPGVPHLLVLSVTLCPYFFLPRCVIDTPEIDNHMSSVLQCCVIGCRV